MSTHAKVSHAAYGEWRVDPDGRQDRKPGPVTTYKLPPEELAKYRTEPYKKPMVINPKQMLERREQNQRGIEDNMSSKLTPKITDEQLLQECREHGTGTEACKYIADKYGMTPGSVSVKIAEKRIIKKLREEESTKDNTCTPANEPAAITHSEEREQPEPRVPHILINDLIGQAHAIATEHGFWDDYSLLQIFSDYTKNGLQNNAIGNRLMLIVSEISEAQEALRKGIFKGDHGFEEEIADVFIRLGDLCGGLNIDIEPVILAKMEKNKNRPYKHGKQF